MFGFEDELGDKIEKLSMPEFKVTLTQTDDGLQVVVVEWGLTVDEKIKKAVMERVPHAVTEKIKKELKYMVEQGQIIKDWKKVK